MSEKSVDISLHFKIWIQCFILQIHGRAEHTQTSWGHPSTSSTIQRIVFGKHTAAKCCGFDQLISACFIHSWEQPAPRGKQGAVLLERLANWYWRYCNSSSSELEIVQSFHFFILQCVHNYHTSLYYDHFFSPSTFYQFQTTSISITTIHFVFNHL